jgi:hypothetical protein
VPTYVKGERGKYQLVVSDKSWESLKQKIKAITRKTTPATFDERIWKLKELQRGWLGYYRMANIHEYSGLKYATIPVQSMPVIPEQNMPKKLDMI